MAIALATAPSEACRETFDSPVGARALKWAEEWYPAAQLAVTGVTDAKASVLIEVDGDIRLLHYENLDVDVPRCDICGRPA